jgi:DNA-binding LacI/PurR family transcriptional regulator
VARKNQRVTLDDVARLARVSRATASMILSRREPQYSRHARATIERVERTAAELGYVPNPMAAALRRQQSLFFGVSFELSEDRGYGPISGHPGYAWEVFGGITRAARKHRYYPVYIPCPDAAADDEDHDLDQVIPSGLCGLIARVRRETWDSHVSKWEQAGIPCISLFDRGTPRRPRYYVDLDNISVGRLAWEYLSERGHERILSIWTRGLSRAQVHRLKGYRYAVTASGGQPFFLGLHGWSPALGRDDPRDAALLIAALEKSRATAIFAVSGAASMIAYEALGRRSVSIPEQCSFLGIDTPSATYQGRFMTQVICPGDDLGYEAASLLARRIDGEIGSPTGVLIQPRITEHRSVAPR